MTLAYQWYRGGVKIAKATKKTYVVIKGDRGRRLNVVVTGAKKGYATFATSSRPTKKVV